MIFLKENTLLERDICADDVKSRLLGHWGTCPGLSLVYAHANRLIRKTKQDMLYIVGPGHGAPAILACLWLEKSLGTFWPDYARNKKGLANLISGFSVPGGFPRFVPLMQRCAINTYADPRPAVISMLRLQDPSMKVESSVTH